LSGRFILIYILPVSLIGREEDGWALEAEFKEQFNERDAGAALASKTNPALKNLSFSSLTHRMTAL
jgi:hypothetical protein